MAKGTNCGWSQKQVEEQTGSSGVGYLPQDGPSRSEVKGHPKIESSEGLRHFKQFRNSLRKDVAGLFLDYFVSFLRARITSTG